ncbi:MAG: glycerol-3-phosphate 1-O-acyltransferase PlsY [Leptospirales bacterium]
MVPESLPMWAHYIAVIFGAYLLGSIPTAYLIAIQKNIDIRKEGSGNVGATNAFRVLGKRAGGMVLFFDAFKGFITILLIEMTFQTEDKVYLVLTAGTFATIGHVFPVWLSFKGGKGVATMCGVLIAISPYQFFIAAGVFFLILFLFRFISLSSMFAAATLPLTFFLFYEFESNMPIFIFFMVLSIFIILMHHENIKRMFTGTESRFTSLSKH